MLVLLAQHHVVLCYKFYICRKIIYHSSILQIHTSVSELFAAHDVIYCALLLSSKNEISRR